MSGKEKVDIIKRFVSKRIPRRKLGYMKKKLVVK